MYSEALKILDRNTEQYMIEIMQKEIENQAATIETKETEIKDLLEARAEDAKVIAKLKAQLEASQSHS